MILRALCTLLMGLAALAAAAAEPIGELRVEIHQPADGQLLTSLEREIRVEGGASIFGGVQYLDLLLVLDSSKSLEKTDPKDHRAGGVTALVRSLPAKSDIRVGLVDFDNDAELVAPLTADREAIVRGVRGLNRRGTTDLADGIRTALAAFASGARADATRVMLLFTDGRSNEKKALAAAAEARAAGVAIHTVLLGSDEGGAALLAGIARATGGSAVRVTRPEELPGAFLGLRTTGVERVTLSANGAPHVPAELSGGTFAGVLPLRPGRNRLVAEATSLDGEVRLAEVYVTVADELRVSIETPLEGTLYTEGEREAAVTGTASLFGDLPPELWAAQPDHGVRQVLLQVGDSPPFATTLEGGRFRGRVLLAEGENRILATATAVDGRAADAAVVVTVRPPGCGELEVAARRDGQPALSVSDRAVEIVLDASGSMWGQIDGRSKMEIAKEILDDALGWMPPDLSVALRVYGHQQPRERRDCTDSALLVPFGAESRAQARAAIPGFRPRGQTPLAHSLAQVPADFGDFRGERAVVLVTDGIESCGGDPAAAAAALQVGGSLPVHVIGFGLGGQDGDTESLRAIATASGGQYLAAESAEELRQALSVTVGTAFQVLRQGAVVAEGALGGAQALRLPPGRYALRVASVPPQEIPLEIAPEQALALVLERAGATVTPQQRARPTGYVACREPAWVARSPDGEAPPAAAP